MIILLQSTKSYQTLLLTFTFDRNESLLDIIRQLGLDGHINYLWGY